MKKRKIISLLSAVFMIAAAFSLGSLTVSANEDSRQPLMVLDYISEVVHWDSDNDDTLRDVVVDGKESVLNENVVLLYALRANENSLDKAKWIPTYSGAIDISRYIPRRAGAPYIIAFRWSDQEPVKENVRFVELKARQPIGRGDVWYDVDKQYIIANGKGFEVKIGDDVWYENEIGWGELIGNNTNGDASPHDQPLLLPMDFLPTGGVAQARKSPIHIENENGEVDNERSEFASVTIRIRLPRPSRPVDASKITLVPQGGRVSDAHFKGFRDKMEVFVGIREDNNGNTTEVWETLSRNMKISDFDKLFETGGNRPDGSGKDTSRTDWYRFRVRNKASGSRPASPVTILEFSREAYDKTLETNESGT